MDPVLADTLDLGSPSNHIMIRAPFVEVGSCIFLREPITKKRVKGTTGLPRDTSAPRDL